MDWCVGAATMSLRLLPKCKRVYKIKIKMSWHNTMRKKRNLQKYYCVYFVLVIYLWSWRLLSLMVFFSPKRLHLRKFFIARVWTSSWVRDGGVYPHLLSVLGPHLMPTKANPVQTATVYVKSYIASLRVFRRPWILGVLHPNVPSTFL